MVSPFYIEPAIAGRNVQQGLSGLGTILDEQLAAKKAQETNNRMLELFKTGKPGEIAEFMIQNPDQAQRLQSTIGWRDEQTKQNAYDTFKKIEMGQDPVLALTERISYLDSLGVDSSDTVEELQEAMDDPETYRQTVPKRIEAFFPDRYMKELQLQKTKREVQMAGQPELTGTQKEYEAAKREGFTGSFIEYQKALKGGPDSDVRTMMLQAQLLDLQDRIGERQSKADKVQEAEQNKIRSITQTVDSVLTEVGLAKELAKEGALSTGMGAAVTENIPGTPAYNLRKTVDTVKANLGFDKLQQMREASPTGGALGSVTERELDLLQATIANLDPKMGDDELLRNLEKVERHYNNWKRAVSGGGSAPAQQSGFSESDIAEAARKVGMTPQQFRQEMGL